MLCSLCSTFDIDKLVCKKEVITGYHPFHSDLASLSASAPSCDFCQLVWTQFQSTHTPEKLAEFAEKKMRLGMPPVSNNFRLRRYQGASELWVYAGNTVFRHQYLAVRFAFCTDRTEREITSGLLDPENFGTRFNVSGRPCYESADSGAALALARNWLRDCISPGVDSDGCACLSRRDKFMMQTSVSELEIWRRGGILNDSRLSDGCLDDVDDAAFIPTRLINVGDEPTGMDPFLECVFDRKPLRRSWAALSHCWGGKSVITTTTENLTERMTGIPLESMPRTFRDAIILTRSLGIKYLWVDSLCILQDSADDWSTQSYLMAQIYSYSIVNIAAHTSRHADHGMFKPRAKKFKPVWLPIHSTQQGTSGEMLVCPPTNNWEESLSSTHSQLVNRGWVLQESVLSPRTLHVSDEQIFYECAGKQLAEGDLKPVHIDYAIREDYDWLLSKRYFSPRYSQYAAPPETLNADIGKLEERKKVVEVWHNRWYELVTDYSRRKLTRPTDVFVALEGLNTKIWEYIGQYAVAGMYLDDLIRGLLWEVEIFDTNVRVDPCRAPTWSWASLEGPVRWPIRENSEQIATCPVEVLGHSPAFQRSNPTDRWVDLRGRWRLSTSWEECKIPDDTGGWYFTDAHGLTHIGCRFDAGSYKDWISPSFAPSEDWGFLQISSWDIYSHLDTVRVTYALILRVVPEREGYERIGVGHIFVNEDDHIEKGLGWEIATVRLF